MFEIPPCAHHVIFIKYWILIKSTNRPKMLKFHPYSMGHQSWICHILCLRHYNFLLRFLDLYKVSCRIFLVHHLIVIWVWAMQSKDASEKQFVHAKIRFRWKCHRNWLFFWHFFHFTVRIYPCKRCKCDFL